MTTPIRTCSHCGCTADNLIEFHDRLLCPDCLEEMTKVCVDCGTRFWNRECPLAIIKTVAGKKGGDE